MECPYVAWLHVRSGGFNNAQDGMVPALLELML